MPDLATDQTSSGFPPVGYHDLPPPWPGHLRICFDCCYKREQARTSGHPNACSLVGYKRADNPTAPTKHTSPDLYKSGGLEICSGYITIPF